MSDRKIMTWLALSLASGIGAGDAVAHMTPPVALISERDAVVAMSAGAKKFFVREVRLTPEERAAIQKQWGWRAEEEFYRFYLARDGEGRVVAAVTFLTEITMHGAMRVAVGLGPDGKVKDAKVVELTEETFSWLKPLMDQDFARDYAGRASKDSFGLSERFTKMRLPNMVEFHARIVASLIQRAAVLFDVAVVKRGVNL